jgi:hypothetical protein
MFTVTRCGAGSLIPLSGYLERILKFNSRMIFYFMFLTAPWVFAQTVTPTPDVSSIIPFLPKGAKNIEVVQMIQKDVMGNGSFEKLWVVRMDSDDPGLDNRMSFVLIVGDDGQLLWQKNIDGYGSALVFGEINKSLPVCFGYYDWMAASAGAGPWHFYIWKSGSSKDLKKDFYEVTPEAEELDSGGIPVFRDINGDGFNDLVFENENAKYQPLDQIFIWNPQRQIFEENENFPAYWQPQIDKYFLKLQKVADKQRSSFSYIDHLAKLFAARGGNKGVEEFRELAKIKMEPFLKDDRNDSLQRRADETLKRMAEALGESIQ